MTPQRTPSLLPLALAALAMLLLAACGGSSSGSTSKGKSNKKSSAPKKSGSGRAGKTPDRPAPSLSQATLGQFRDIYDEAKGLWNEAETARRGGDQATFKSKGKECQQVLERASELVSDHLEWHEEADMDGWAMPSEYVTLEGLFQKYAELRNKARKIGS